MSAVKCKKCREEYSRPPFRLDTGFCPACRPRFLDLFSIGMLTKGFMGGGELDPDERKKVGHLGARIGIGIISAMLAFLIGMGYQHKCDFGNKSFEWSMLFAYPAMALLFPVVSRYTKMSLVFNGLLLLAGVVVRSAYMHSIH